MRQGLLWFALLATAVLAGPAQADDDLAAMNAVSRSWDRYAQLSSHGDPETTQVLARRSFDYFAFLRETAVYGSAEQVRRIPLSERAVVYALRDSMTPEQLLALDGPAVARHCFKAGLYGVPAARDGQTLPKLTHVTLIAGDRAVGELGPPTGTQFQYGPVLVREDGEWKVQPESLALDGSSLIQQQIARSGVTETQMLEYLVADLLDQHDAAPSLATLDRPMRDDAAARTRINESWPSYEDTYRARLAATENKADDGDSLAMFAFGALLYSGAMPALVPKDTERGLQWLEKASNAGYVPAAAAISMALMQDYTPVKGKPVPADLVARTVVHTRRAAEGGVPTAMVALGNFIFNGAAGKRDCAQAEEWAARGEDAGVPQARNERVWYLATCPITAQRDPERAMQLASHMITQADTLPAAELDTVAAALAASGRFDEAVDFQQRAIGKLGTDAPETRRRMQQRLGQYQRHHDWVQDYNQYELPAL
jgi:TPR repeat protein